MSRTVRRPPPPRRLRAGYVKRLCWRCRGRVSDCSCPARDLALAPEIECEPTIEHDERLSESCDCDDCREAYWIGLAFGNYWTREQERDWRAWTAKSRCDCDDCEYAMRVIASRPWWQFVEAGMRPLTLPFSSVMPKWRIQRSGPSCDCYSCDSTGRRY